MIDDLEDFDDTPAPPPPEFDRDAEFALAMPGLSEEQRARIISEARRLAVSGLAQQALGNWICREVARTVGGTSGFDAYDARGNVIDPPHFAEVRKQIKIEAGKKRQSKRNAVLHRWRQRFWQLIDAGWSEEETWERCWAAIHGLHLRANKKPVATKAIAPEFEGLPLVYGRDGKTPPRDKRRFRAHFIDRVCTS